MSCPQAEVGAQHPPAAHLPAGSLPAGAWGPWGVPKEPARSPGSRCHTTPASLHTGAVPPAGAAAGAGTAGRLFLAAHTQPGLSRPPGSAHGVASSRARQQELPAGSAPRTGQVRRAGTCSCTGRAPLPAGRGVPGAAAPLPSVHPAPDPPCRGVLPGLLALMARDLLAPRLQLFLTTFPSCSRASIVLAPKQLSPPRHVPPAPPDLQLALRATRSPTGSRPHRAPSHPRPPHATPSRPCHHHSRDRDGQGIRTRPRAGLTLSAARNLGKKVLQPSGREAALAGTGMLPKPCLCPAQGDHVHLPSGGTSAPPNTAFAVAPAADSATSLQSAGRKPPWLHNQHHDAPRATDFTRALALCALSR